MRPRSFRLRRRKPGQGLRRGVYVIPSLFTVANLLCGFLSVVAASNGQMARAAELILLAIIADILDGRIARLTGTTTPFGAAYDSLADVMSFGAAPAMLALTWAFWQHPRLGPTVAFLFLVAGSIRLARFNSRVQDPQMFQGLPIPAAAGAVAMLVLLSPEPVTHPAALAVVAGLLVVLASLMVSSLPYPTFKDVNLRRQWPASSLLGIALILLVVVVKPELLAVLVVAYILSPAVTMVARWRRRGRVPTTRLPTPGSDTGAVE